MSRIAKRFAELRAQGRKALIPYFTAGDPDPSQTVPLMHTLVAAGADLIELGVPFSDPMSDGPVIQAACERALTHDVKLTDIFAMVREFRQTDPDTPVVLMGYLNPLEVMGYRRFAELAAEAGVDGVLTVDLPPEEAAELTEPMAELGLDPIFLVAPTTTRARLEKICGVARGFVYYVSLKGVTGSASLDVAAVAERVEAIREYSDLPVGVGFGIGDAESAARVAAVSDAVVVGSALVRRIAEYGAEPERMRAVVGELLGGMRAAMDQSSRATA
ncbi:tryptophan synthase subunit alpha [Alkalilimnicola sp. S0819]|uniref:tryptophan synthase subunit alpha n=1 Tax=Alkalilimnicola sp. S0819 TaxID=2613922 RepID=UPI00126276B0|nr:tryptophan synthase subunit alpha [Alkalilimnicola sp. S0819]KAB7627863.1 tryptophan synthase subunit alpha [Alkalilimnicola sp. S0819]MPQ15497.1 tryptophan synthase subunit alpha [Alkalilimnicola sp. S0819]